MTKAIYISIIICLLFPGCNKDIKEIKENNYDFINKITEDDLRLLKGVNISTRKLGGQISDFDIIINDESYKIPVYSNPIKRERIMNSEWYDVEKYALKKGIDNANSYDYVRSYSDKIVTLFNNLNVLAIRSIPQLGDFTIFYVGTSIEHSTEEIVYLPKKGIVKHDYWEEFFLKAKSIKEGWYLHPDSTSIY